MSNRNTFPRTLQETSLGPYASGPIESMPDPHARPAHEWALYVLAVVAVAVVVWLLWSGK